MNKLRNKRKFNEIRETTKYNPFNYNDAILGLSKFSHNLWNKCIY